MPILKLGFFYPLPEKKIKDFIKSLKKVLIVEELEGYLEKEIQVLAKGVNCELEVIGKELLPEIGELNTQKIATAIARITGKKFPEEKQTFYGAGKIPKRFPKSLPWLSAPFNFFYFKKIK